MPETIQKHIIQQNQFLFKFIKHLSKKDFHICKDVLLNIDSPFIKQAQACIINGQDYSQENKRQIKELKNQIQFLQRVKGFKLAGDQEQNNLKLSIFSLLQNGNYIQAYKLSPNPFILSLLQYSQLKNGLKEIGKKRQENDAFKGSQEYYRLQQRLTTQILLKQQLKLLDCVYTSQNQQLQKLKQIRPQLYAKIKKMQTDFKEINHNNSKYLHIIDSCKNYLKYVQIKKQSSPIKTIPIVPKFQTEKKTKSKSLINKQKIFDLQQKVKDLQEQFEQCLSKAIQLNKNMGYLIQSDCGNSFNASTNLRQILGKLQQNLQAISQSIKLQKQTIKYHQSELKKYKLINNLQKIMQKNAILSQKQETIRQMQQDIYSLQQENKNMKQKLTNQQKKYKLLEQSQIEYTKLDNKQHKIQSSIILNNRQTPAQEINVKITELQVQNSRQLSELQTYKDKLEQQAKQYIKLNNNHQQLAITFDNTHQKLSKAEEQNKALTEKVKQLSNEITTLTSKLKQEKQNNQAQIEQISQLNNMLEDMQKINSQLQYSNNKQQSAKPVKKIEQESMNDRYIKEKLIKWEQQNKQIKKDLLKQKKQCENMKEKTKEMATQNQHIKVKLKKYQQQLKRRDQQIHKIKAQNKQLTQNINKASKNQKKQNNHRCISHLFTAKQIFEQGESQRLHLIKILEDEIGKIHQTKLLYSYDAFNKVNFHRYIDNHKNLLVIAKTALGKHIAAYSESQLSVDGGFRGKGLLMPLWDKSSLFHLIQGKRSVSYDDYYLIYGNSQVRIRSQENKIFSNFGIANGYFDNQRKRVQHLLGQNERQIDLDTYQIYEVIFERDIQQ